MRHDLDFALDHCLVELRGGTDIKRCLEIYPEYAGELKPLLQLAAAVGSAVPPASSHAAFAMGRERMLVALARKRGREATTAPLIRAIKHLVQGLIPERARVPALAWGLAAVLLVIVFAFVGGTAAAASARSLPGDVLYPLKLAGQRVQVALTFDETQQQGVEERLWAQQRQDVQLVLDGGRRVEVAFHGLLESRKGDLWVVGGLPVRVLESTEISGQPWLGALVQVEANLPGNGDLLATRLLVEPGAVELPGQTPTATATSTPSRTAEPSDTPRPTETAEPAQSPAPVSIQEPAETAEPGDTPDASEAYERGVTPVPVATFGPEFAPLPTEKPQHTAEPTDEPQPGNEAEPTEATEPEDRPEPGRETEPTDSPETEHESEPARNTKPTDVPEPEPPPESGRDPEPTDDSEPGDERDRRETPEPADESEREGDHGDREPEHDPSKDPGSSEALEGDGTRDPRGETRSQAVIHFSGKYTLKDATERR